MCVVQETTEQHSRQQERLSGKTCCRGYDVDVDVGLYSVVGEDGRGLALFVVKTAIQQFSLRGDSSARLGICISYAV